jgi:hypothetical protein
LQLESDALGVHRRVNAIKIVKRLSVIQRAVTGELYELALGRLDIDLGTYAEVFPQHHVAANAQEEASEARG